MPVYLRWLRGRLDALGGTLTRMSLAALPRTDGVVVNCAGLGSRRLAGDEGLRPVRGTDQARCRPVQPLQSVRGGQSLRGGQPLQSVQPVCGGQPVQSLQAQVTRLSGGFGPPNAG
jgi:hypothetical protein